MQGKVNLREIPKDGVYQLGCFQDTKLTQEAKQNPENQVMFCAGKK